MCCAEATVVLYNNVYAVSPSVWPTAVCDIAYHSAAHKPSIKFEGGQRGGNIFKLYKHIGDM